MEKLQFSFTPVLRKRPKRENFYKTTLAGSINERVLTCDENLSETNGQYKLCIIKVVRLTKL